MSTFAIEVEHDDDTLEVTVTPPERGGETFTLEIPGEPKVIGTWSLRDYQVEGLVDESLADAVTDAIWDQYAEAWELEVKTLEASDGAVGAGLVDRIGGSPIGVSVERWPSCMDEPMQHVVTIARQHLDPDVVLPADTVAVALFMWNPEENEAFEPDTSASAVLFLTAEEVAQGTTTGRPEGYDASRELDGAPLLVKTETGSHFDLVGDHVGWPLHWCQDDESEPEHGSFLFQFTEDLVDVNLGDAGTMYVFANAAWWQCH